MNYFWVFIIFIVLFCRRRKHRRVSAAAVIRRRKQEAKVMEEMIRSYIGKEVIIYTLSGEGHIDGVLESAQDGWATVTGFDSGERQSVNLEYVVRVREYPHDKNGKRKLIFD